MKPTKLRNYKDKAAELTQAGNYRKALSMYRDILEAFPNDSMIMIKVGDLCRRLDMIEEAVSVYSNAAQYYAGAGDLLKGIAICRTILDIEPSHVQTQKILAELYTRKYGTDLSKETTVVDAAQTGVGAASDGATTPHVIQADVTVVSELPQARRVSIMPNFIEIDFTEAVASSAPPGRLSDIPDMSEDLLEVYGDSVTPDARMAEIPLPDVDFNAADGLGFGSIPPVDAAAVSAVLKQAVDGDGTVPCSESEPFDDLICKMARPVFSGEALPVIPLFSSLDRDSFVDLLSKVSIQSYEPFQSIVEEGDFGDSFFVIISGCVEVRRQGVTIAMLDDGAFFGEMALVHPGPRNASVVTVSPCQIMEISNHLLNEMKTSHPEVAATVVCFTDERLLNNLMLTSPLFTCFSIEDQKDLVTRFDNCEFLKGDVIIREGEQPDGMHLVVLGSVSVYTADSKGEPLHVAVIRESDIFGEMSLLTRKPALATIIADEHCRTLRLSRSRFNEVIMTHPQILELISSISDERVLALHSIKRPVLASTYGGGAALL